MLNLKRTYLFNLFLLFLAFMFVFIFCAVSSPLTIYYTCDSSIFMTMGRLFIEGKTPYIDFFDHKGPVIILIEALGQLFAPYRKGIFILEILNLFFVFILINKIATLLLNRKMTITIILLFIVLLSSTISGGNSTEEFSLTPLFIALYVTCKFFFKSHSLKASDIFIIGLCFSSLFWLRLNNAGAICGMLFFLFVNSIARKDYKSLKNIIVYFLIAQLPLTLLFVAYFYYHDGLYDLIYATFIFNFKYTQPPHIGKHIWLSLLLIAIAITGTLLQYKKNRDKSIFLFTFSILIFNILTSNIGYVFKHYLILLMPSYILSMMLVLGCISDDKVKKIVFYISVVSAVAVFTVKGNKEIKSIPENRRKFTSYSDSAKKILNNIQPNQMNQVYYYKVDPSFYSILRVSPNYKYFILQEWQGSHDANIYVEINETMCKTPPLWVMIEKKDNADWNINELDNKGFCHIIESLYKPFSENDNFILYKYK